MKNTIKKTYQSPLIDKVVLDSNISLTLDSSLTPLGDPEFMMLGAESFNSDPMSLEML